MIAASIAKWSLTGKVIPILVGGAFIAGTGLGGWALNEFWLGKTARADLKAQEQTVLSLKEELGTARVNITLERGLKDAAISANADLKIKLEEREDRLDAALDQTISAAARIPKDVHRIEVRGQEIGERLAAQSGNEWLRNIIPPELWDVAWGDYAAPPSGARIPGEVPLAGADQTAAN